MADTSIKVPLSRPITVHDAEVKTLTFREPMGSDYAEHGFPVIFSDDGSFRIDAAIMNNMMAALAGAPPSSLGSMSGKDWSKCLMRLLPDFFDQGETS